MGSRKRKQQQKMNSDSSGSSPHSQNNQSSQTSDRKRSKNYSKDETNALMKICQGYHGIISKNSNSKADKTAKANAWKSIKANFDKYFISQGIQVSIL